MSIKRMKTLTVGETTYQVVDSTVPDWAREPTKPTDFANGGTMDGSLVINGDLTVNGTSTTVETYNENINVEDNTITLRHNATTGLQNGDYTGIVAQNYDGANNGMLVFDNGGTAYVGDAGDLQPLATRAFTDSDDGALAAWDASAKTLTKAPVEVEDIVTKENVDSLNKALSTATEDNSIAYQKDVTVEKASYAEITKIGGITRKCTNLIPFPYADGDLGAIKEQEGITWTVNSDCSVKRQGTATGTSVFNFFNDNSNPLYLPNGQYVISNSIDGTSMRVLVKDATGKYTTYVDKFAINKGDAIERIYSVLYADAAHNDTMFPMLNAGDTVLPYELYFKGLRSAKVTEVKSVGVNLFDLSKLKNTTAGIQVYDEKIVVTTASYDASVNTGCLLKELAPQLRVGDIVTLNALTTGTDKYVWIDAVWYFGEAKTITETLLNSVVYFYASGVSSSATISEIMLNKGSIAQPYIPYVERTLPIPVEVRGSENLIPYPYYYSGSVTNGGVAIAVNGDGSITLNGTCTSDNEFTFMVSGAIKVNGTYTLSSKVVGSYTGRTPYIQPYIDNVYQAAPYLGEQYTYNWDGTLTSLHLFFKTGTVFSDCTVYPMLNEGITALSYDPYGIAGLDGYGLGVNESVYNYIAWNPDSNIKTWNKRVDIADLGTFEWIFAGYYAYPLGLKAKAKVEGACLANVPSAITSYYINNYGDFLFFFDEGTYTDAETIKAAMSGVMLVYELAEPVVTDISDLIGDNSIGVQSNGTLTFENEYGYAVPSEVVFYKEKAEIVAADKIVGNLIGVSTRAISDEDGNSIANTYMKKSNALEVISGLTENQLQKLISFINTIELQ